MTGKDELDRIQVANRVWHFRNKYIRSIEESPFNQIGLKIRPIRFKSFGNEKMKPGTKEKRMRSLKGKGRACLRQEGGIRY